MHPAASVSQLKLPDVTSRVRVVSSPVRVVLSATEAVKGVSKLEGELSYDDDSTCEEKYDGGDKYELQMARAEVQKLTIAMPIIPSRF